MSTQKHFRLTREAALLAVIAAAFPVTGYCVVAGRADFVVGDVVAVAADGKQRPLVKGAEINSGDAISTAIGARAQLRFTDGGYISLQPNTQFRVDTYQYEGKTDGKEKGFFSLLKGGLRAISGVIGHANRESYQVATPAATIGIRGTGYNAMLGEGLSVSVTDGIVTLTNKGGSLIIPHGQSAYVADENTAPTLTFDKPSTPPASFGGSAGAPVLHGFVSGDNPMITPLITPLLTGTAIYNFALSNHDNCNDACKDAYNILGETGTLNSSGHLVSFTNRSVTTNIGTASVTDSGNDGIIAWGRWVEGVIANNDVYNPGTQTFSGTDSLHYIVGPVTPANDMLALSTLNVTATYSLLGGTHPTATGNGGEIGSLNSGSMVAHFGTHTVDVNLGISFQTAGTYSIAASGLSISGSGFSGSGTANATGGSCCSSFAPIQGFFAGAGASRAGLGYSFYDGSGSAGYVKGVAAFKQQSSVITPY